MTTATYYTDFGAPLRVEGDVDFHTLPRYAAWTWNPAKRRHEVAETGDDLAALRAKYGPGTMVHLARPGAPEDGGGNV